MEARTTGKRIVSKDAYIRAQGKRAGIGFLGIGLFLLAVVVLFLAMSMGATRLQQYSWGHLYLAHDDKALTALTFGSGISVSGHREVWDDHRHLWVGVEYYQAQRYAQAISQPRWWVENALGLLVFSLVAVLLVRLMLASIKRVVSITPGVPLTRANTGDLPAPQSLVRASAEPMQAQEAVLLRAVAEGQETLPEQLVRAANKWE